MSPAVTVLIEDQCGNLTSSTSSIALTITTNPCGGSPVVTNGMTVNAVSGTATFSSLQISKECIGYALTATDATDGNLTVPSTTFTVSALVTSSANVLQDAATDSGRLRDELRHLLLLLRVHDLVLPQYAGDDRIHRPRHRTYQVNWTSLPTNGSYSVVAVGTDNATNSTTSTPPIPVTVDGNGPTGGIISVPMLRQHALGPDHEDQLHRFGFGDGQQHHHPLERSRTQRRSLPDERLHRCHHRSPAPTPVSPTATATSTRSPAPPMMGPRPV